MKANLQIVREQNNVNRNEIVKSIIDDDIHDFKVLCVSKKSIVLKHMKTKEKKRAFWSERKKRYSIDGKYRIRKEDGLC